MKNIFLLIILSGLVFSQKLQVSVNKNPITQGENFRVTFSLDSQGSNFSAPSFSGFQVVGGPSQSSSTSIVNGRMSVQTSFAYVLKAANKGDFFIGPASIKVNGETIKSSRLKVRVVEPSAAEKLRRKQEKEQQKSIKEQANKIIKDNLYMKVKVSKSKAYLGEQILASYELYANEDLNIVNLEINEMPNFNGFWTQDFDREAKWQPEVIKGVRFRKAVIKQVLLYPQQSGNLTLDAMKWDAVVRLRTQGNNRRRRSIFDDFFDRGSYQDFNYVVNSGQRKIEIKDLPDPKPFDFYGGVGDFSMEAWLDKTQTVTGDPVTLKVKISGNGNLKLLSPPDFEFPPDFQVFEPKLIDNSTSNLSGTSGNIVFEYLLIPKTPGEFKINPIEWSYFDLENSTYSSLSSDEFQVSVAKGDENNNSSFVSGVNKENLQYIGKDIRFIKTDFQLQKSGSMFAGSLLFWFLWFLGFLIILFIILINRKKDESESAQNMAKIRKAKKVAVRKLEIAKKYLDNAENSKFYDEMSKALWGYLSDKLQISSAELTKDNAKEKLQSSGVDVATSDEILEIIQTCEFARYAPSDQNTTPTNMYEKSKDLIIKIEGVLK